MGFRFRKVFNIKGFHINLSKKGIGYSIGNKFFRIGKTADAKVRKTVTLPGTGLSHITERDEKNLDKVVENKNKKSLKEMSFDELIDSTADKIDKNL